MGDGRIGGLASPGEVHGARGLGRTRRDGASTVDGAPGVALADRGFRGDAEADEGRVPVRLLPLGLLDPGDYFTAILESRDGDI